MVLKREAEYFGDIVILPFMDRYELVVLKTVAICEFGVRYISLLGILLSLSIKCKSSFICVEIFEIVVTLCNWDSFILQVQNLTAAYIMKCDDDTFVRLDVVLREMNNAAGKKPLYMGNLNLLHRPLRTGKWAVTFEVSNSSIFFKLGGFESRCESNWLMS